MLSWTEPHGFIQNVVADANVCRCGIPLLAHDAVVRDRSTDPIQDGGSPVPEHLRTHIQHIIDAGPDSCSTPRP